MIDVLIGLFSGFAFVLGFLILVVILVNINRLIDYRKKHIWVSLDWFKVVRFFVYAVILIAGSLYLL